MVRIVLPLIFLATVTCAALAQPVEVSDDAPPATGKEKAGGYFKDRKASQSHASAPAPGGGDVAPRYLALRVGTFFSSDGYRWGHGDQGNTGKLNAGLDYRLGEWVNSADLALRVDYTNFALSEGFARKLSLGGIVTFPDANSRFPLYFGAGLGLGFFLKQIRDESALSLDYSLLAGARFMNVIGQTGFLVETGIKNHLHLFSDGQFNGIYINAGAVFSF